MGHPHEVQTQFLSVEPQSERARSRTSARRLVALAIEPTGVGPYVDAIRELIEAITPRPAPARPQGALRSLR